MFLIVHKHSQPDIYFFNNPISNFLYINLKFCFSQYIQTICYMTMYSEYTLYLYLYLDLNEFYKKKE